MASFSLILIIIFGMLFSGLFSGAETGIYQVSRLRLRLGIDKKQFSSVILGRALRDTPGLITSTLVGTNLSIYAVTSAVTYIMLKKTDSGHSAEFFATLITAPPLFIFSELIPKNLFFYYSDTLMLKIAPLLFVFYRLLSWCGIIAIFKYISLFLAKITHTPVPSSGIINAMQRHETAAFFKDIHEESFLTTVQADIVNRLLVVSNTTVDKTMIHLKKAQLVSIESNRQSVLDTVRENSFTRLPVYANARDNIIGFVNVYEVLCSEAECSDLREYIKPIKRLPQNTLVTDAMEAMQVEKEKMALIIRIGRKNNETAVGIITMKDLVGELFGELSEKELETR